MRAVLLPLLCLAAPALAQERIPSHCLALAGGPERVWRASLAPVEADAVAIRFVDHAMFLIRTPSVSAVTDFAGFLGNTTFLPDVVTMNHAHSTHWTPNPDPAIPHVLRGWPEGGEAPRHRLDLGEMLVRNVSTDIRRGAGVEADGNSIFVFEAAGLCIGHLGHLHHEPTEEDYALLGRIDVVMVPVDGGLTLDHATLVRTLGRLRARVVIPMHWFGPANLEAFLGRMEREAGYRVERAGASEVVLRRGDLPEAPTVLVLDPAWLSD
ncbi:MBL fold metallo-hydrolase [Rubellimicrobium sp. CFH 75288]|uniref:MBL fold metallo-hydrolase n=1 Tax=Rubellimicrobium sp. CFH 75288 TaxID=2697034 RepID=UPI001412585B|nr:MBL fold metallo-hydrolase [Rubellimicrobium sp. CFH 75288]NAZ35598.1 Zn-dependent hydrolase [Rubellimicrobium sp. CFH 75288]